MRLVSVDDVVDGDTLGRELYDSDGRLMLRQGMRLNDRLIEGIKKRGHRYLFIQLSEKRERQSEADLLGNLRFLTKDLLDRLFRSLLDHASIPVESVLGWADHVAYSVAEASDLTIRMRDLQRHPAESEWIAHSLNVVFLAMMTAKELGYAEEQIKEVAIGSLLHDIGLVRPHNGTVVLQHPIVGQEMLRRSSRLPGAALKIVAQHHEQIDGRGFPLGLSGEAVSEAAQIVGACSEFDYFMNDTTASRLPCEGVEFMMSKIDSSFSYGVVRAFIKSFQPYPVGTEVRLTGGLHAVVCEQNKGQPCRPVVKLKQFGSRFDLLEHTTFMIEEVVLAN